MLIATERKTGQTLSGSLTPEALAAFSASFATPAFAQQHGEPDIVLSDAALAHLARQRCADHIARHYPTHKQLNLMRGGSAAEQARMDTFINACRQWSNGARPDLAALQDIVP